MDPQTQEVVEEITNDLTLGEYSVVVTTVPRRDTYDEVVFEQLRGMRELGVQIPDHVLIENSNMSDRKEVAEQVKQIQGLAAPTEAELEKAAILEDLQMRALAADVSEKEAHAMERQAKAQALMAEAQERTVKPEIEQLRIGTEARVALEGQESTERMNTTDLIARIQLMKDKTGSAERIATVGSATKRMEGALKRETDLDKLLLSIASKTGPE